MFVFLFLKRHLITILCKIGFFAPTLTARCPPGRHFKAQAPAGWDPGGHSVLRGQQKGFSLIFTEPSCIPK